MKWLSYRRFYSERHSLVHAALLLVTCLLVFSENFDHAFHLDSQGGLLQNHYVRTLKNIPLYFVDPLTLTNNTANADYRPILQLTFALNYAVSGYEMWSWHLFQILLHASCAFGLYRLCRRLLLEFHPHQSQLTTAHLSLLVALIFAVHPYTSGVVNYLWARPSLLTSAFLFPSILLYMKSQSSNSRLPWSSWSLYTLALFTKVEAVACLGVYLLCEVLRVAKHRVAPGPTHHGRAGDREGFLADVLQALNRRTLRRLWPFLLTTLIYLVIRDQVMPAYAAEARHAAEVGHWAYFWTQTTAWWHYVLRWFAPIHLIADDLSFPIFHSPWEPRVLLSIAGWVGVAALLRALYCKQPQSTFLVLCALALISPTSSFLPLAEMVNEHRPYMALSLISLVWLVPFLLVLFRVARSTITEKLALQWARCANRLG